MPGREMSGTVGSKASAKPVTHEVHDMSSTPGMTMPDTAGGAMNHDMPGMNMPAGGGGQPMEHDMSSMTGMSMDGQMAGPGAGGTSLAPGNATAPAATKIGRAHVCTPVTHAHNVCRLLLEKTQKPHK